MKPVEQYFIRPDQSVLEAIGVINSTGHQIALIVDEYRLLMGVVSDGDIRRYILKGHSVQNPVREMMNAKPIVISSSVPIDIAQIAKSRRITQFPVVDAEGRIVDLKIYEPGATCNDNPVVLMAGGKGERLRPLTDDQPKPMLQVGNKPILEHIVTRFSEQGFKNFYIAVNYKGEKIESYFRDGSHFGVCIEFIREEKQLGTAGALSLLSRDFHQPIIVMNADVLTKINFELLVKFHLEQKAVATMCVRQYDFQVPFGVIQTEHCQILKIEEKPVHKFFVNAGIYVLNPEVLQKIPKNMYYDMPTLFQSLIDSGRTTAAYPIHEYWSDVGQIKEFNQAQYEFVE